MTYVFSWFGSTRWYNPPIIIFNLTFLIFMACLKAYFRAVHIITFLPQIWKVIVMKKVKYVLFLAGLACFPVLGSDQAGRCDYDEEVDLICARYRNGWDEYQKALHMMLSAYEHVLTAKILDVPKGPVYKGEKWYLTVELIFLYKQVNEIFQTVKQFRKNPLHARAKAFLEKVNNYFQEVIAWPTNNSADTLWDESHWKSWKSMSDQHYNAEFNAHLDLDSNRYARELLARVLTFRKNVMRFHSSGLDYGLNPI